VVAGLSFFGAASPSEDVYVVAVSAPKSSDHTDYSILQFYGKRGITQKKFEILNFTLFCQLQLN